MLRLDPTQPTRLIFEDFEGHEIELIVSDAPDVPEVGRARKSQQTLKGAERSRDEHRRHGPDDDPRAFTGRARVRVSRGGQPVSASARSTA
jgi:hypothetical protein